MNELDQLKKDIQEFEEFKNAIDRQQLIFPLDKKSIDVVQKDVLVPTGNVVVPFSLVSYNDAIEVKIRDKKYLIDTTSIQ